MTKKTTIITTALCGSRKRPYVAPAMELEDIEGDSILHNYSVTNPFDTEDEQELTKKGGMFDDLEFEPLHE